MSRNDSFFIDAGVFIGSLLEDDTRHSEARILVESARDGKISAYTTSGVLSEVYAALTWIKARPPHSPNEASQAVRLLIEPPSHIKIINEDKGTVFKLLELVAKYKLTSRRVHDARHAAAAIIANISNVYTYDLDDWKIFKSEGLIITGPKSILSKLPKNY